MDKKEKQKVKSCHNCNYAIPREIGSEVIDTEYVCTLQNNKIMFFENDIKDKEKDYPACQLSMWEEK